MDWYPLILYCDKMYQQNENILCNEEMYKRLKILCDKEMYYVTIRWKSDWNSIWISNVLNLANSIDLYNETLL